MPAPSDLDQHRHPADEQPGVRRPDPSAVGSDGDRGPGNRSYHPRFPGRAETLRERHHPGRGEGRLGRRRGPSGCPPSAFVASASRQRAAPRPSSLMIRLREATDPAVPSRPVESDTAKSAVPDMHGSALDPSPRTPAVGHAHIDTAWEWPIREAKRKVARSWSTQLALMDERPDYFFAASPPAQHAWMKESYPDIYRRLQAKVATGQWEPVCALRGEDRCNLASAE